MKNYVREPINTFTHMAGAILSVLALIAMILKVNHTIPSVIAYSAVIIFGISMILLYSASSIYHMIVSSDKVIQILRRVDHSMIFILIAGSYAPFCLIAIGGKVGWIMFITIFSIGILGILFKMLWFSCPRWLSTSIYIVMGWLSLIMAPTLAKSLSTGGLVLLVLGGVLYTIGGVIYAIKPKLSRFKHMGHHEIFHVFILLGTLAHYLSVYFYVL